MHHNDYTQSTSQDVLFVWYDGLMTGKYPNTFYRVAVKALIKNEKGQILLVKEKSEKWDLPGGGLDHGEEPEDGLRRELQEEIGVSDKIDIGKIVRQKSFWLDEKQAYLMWIVYEVKIQESSEFYFGDGVTAIQYIDPVYFHSSEDERENYLATFAV